MPKWMSAQRWLGACILANNAWCSGSMLLQRGDGEAGDGVGFGDCVRQEGVVSDGDGEDELESGGTCRHSEGKAT